MTGQIETFIFRADGELPNNELPLVLYRRALPPELRSPAACQALFHQNDWVGNWVDGVFDYWHFHVTGHEVLGCVAGEAEIGFGGDSGVAVTFTAGDVVVIPGGVGHKRLSVKRKGFTVVGGYPPGQSGAISRPGDFRLDEAEARIADLPLPKSDPVTGPEGPLFAAWHLRGR
jgi:uncharacterized protein YjlB